MVARAVRRVAVASIAALAMLALAASCDRDREREPDRFLGEDLSPHRVTERRARMHGRLEGVDLARSALARGDLDAARTIAATIELEPPVDLPPVLRARGDRIGERARELGAAEDLDTAALAFARMLADCGDCHVAARTTWSFPDVPVPEGEEIVDRMHRHAWATERMWEALIVASPSRFDRAADALDVAPLSGETPPDEERPLGVRALEERLRDAAHAARGAGSMAQRAEIYGAILGSCARCHQAVRASAR